MVDYKNIVRVTSNKRDAQREANRISKNLLKRKIKRKAFVVPVSQEFVRKLTREGYTVRKKNYGILMKDVKRRFKK